MLYIFVLMVGFLLIDSWGSIVIRHGLSFICLGAWVIHRGDVVHTFSDIAQREISGGPLHRYMHQ